MTWKLILVILILTAVAYTKKASKKVFSCERGKKYLDNCRTKGYEIKNCVVGDTKVPLKETRRIGCPIIERRFGKRCDEYQCDRKKPVGKGWKAVKRDEEFDYDLETTPLEIQTYSKAGSDDQVRLKFYNKDGRTAGGFYIYFTSTVRYRISWCTNPDSYPSFPSILPSTIDKVWRITLTRESAATRLQVHCNGLEMLDVPISEKTCTRDDDKWAEKWGRQVEQIKFDDDDTASYFYRPAQDRK